MADSYFFEEGFLDPSLQIPVGQFEMDDPTIRQTKRKKQPRQRKKKIHYNYLSEEDEEDFSDASSEGEFYDSSSSESEQSESEDEEAESPETTNLLSGGIPEGVSEYEMTRLKKIQENQQMLQNLGIKHLVTSLDLLVDLISLQGSYCFSRC